MKKCLIFKKIVSFLLSLAIALPIIVNDNFFETETYATKSIVYGDVNSDGNINILDMIFLKSYLVEKNAKNFNTEAADLDKDDNISLLDATELCMYLLKRVESFSYGITIDTDNDGLCDYIEKEILKTNPNNPDSDNDKLTDYEEVYLCGTDPLIYDSGSTGQSDSLKDIDKDGLNNLKEIELKTSPINEDSDGDGINDYDEINKYKTDPLLKDSDADGITDNAELILGLNPKSQKSDGTLDSARIFTQKLNDDNKAIDSINADNNDYSLSISTKSSGYIQESVVISKSTYSAFLDADAIVGDIVDIEYNDSLKINELNIYFNIKQADDINKYCVFKYFKDVNMLLPVETFYDGNKVYATDTEDGTYCIVDTTLIDTGSSALNNVGDTGSDGKIHIIFTIDMFSGVGFVEAGYFETVSKQIIDASKKLFAQYNNVVVDIYGICCANTSSLQYITMLDYDQTTRLGDKSSADVERTLSFFKIYYGISKTYSLETNLLCGAQNFSDNDSNYLFAFPYANAKISQYQLAEVNNCINQLDSLERCHVSFVWIDNDNAKYYPDKLNGKVFVRATTTGEDIYDYIVSQENKNGNSKENSSTRLSVLNNISFNAKITPDWLKASKGQLTKEQIKALELPDSDGDGIYDFEEINMSMITFDSNGNPIFPTLTDICKKNKKSEQGIDFWKEKFSLLKDMAESIIIQVNSDPSCKDSDGDGINDYDETNGVTYTSPNGVKYKYDGALLEKGLANGIIGKLTIVSDNESQAKFWNGHAFLLYESFINDTLDLSGFAKGFNYTEDGDENIKNNWNETDVGKYKISPNRIISIGNYASNSNDLADLLGMSGSGSSGGVNIGQSSSEGAASGIHFNMELRLIYSSEDGSADGPYVRSYGNNSAFCKDISKDQMHDMLEYCNGVNHYSFVGNNCAEIVGKAWDNAFDDDIDFRIWTSTPTPAALKKSINKLDGHFTISFHDDAWLNYINQEVVNW